MLGFFSHKLPEDITRPCFGFGNKMIEVCLMSQCSLCPQPGGVGNAVPVLGLAWGGKDNPTSLLFSVADGWLWRTSPGGSGENCVTALPWDLVCTKPLALLTLMLHFLFPQPGKLTEAFKYFVQGMGYSKWQTQFSVLGWVCSEGNSAFPVHLSPLASVSPPMS